MTYPNIETAEDYTEYESAVASGSDNMEHFSSGPCSGCRECCDLVDPDDYDSDEDWNEAVSEPHFSWSPCELCNRSLGGDRESAHAVSKEHGIIHFDICTDCVYFIEYGRLDDMTMERIGA